MSSESPNLRDAIHKLATDWDSTLHVAGRSYWKVSNVTDARTFFRNLPKIFPYGMTLLFEGLEMGLTAKSLYEENPATYTANVACDTILPIPDSYHVAFSELFADRLCHIIESQGLAAAFYHFKGYSKQEILFTFHTFHDAFEGEIVLSKSLDEASVRAFADASGGSVEHAEFGSNCREQINSIDRALNPTWWRRALNFFKAASRE